MLKEGRIETISIYDEEDDLSYTAFIQPINRNGKNLWYGWFWDYPNVFCETETKEKLPIILKQKLFKTLEDAWEAWDKQIEEDLEAGRLDDLIGKAKKNFEEGRCMDLDEFLERFKKEIEDKENGTD